MSLNRALVLIHVAAAGMIAGGSSVKAGEVRGQVDLQCHMTMHIAVPAAYGSGPKEGPRKPIDFRHMFTQQMHTEWVARSGTPIFLTAAYAAEAGFTRARARRLILKQLRFVREFVKRNSDRFGLARTPEEAREIIAQGKIALVQSIEGAARLLGSPKDAEFWASEGVALITLIHLKDDEFGGAAVSGDPLLHLINAKGNLLAKHHPDRRRGLTRRGREAIRELTEAGIVVDLSHMSQHSREDSMAVLRGLGVPPVVTHGVTRAIRDEDRGLTDAEVRELYRVGGIFGLPLNGANLEPIGRKVAVPADYCPESIDSFKLHYDHLSRLLVSELGSEGRDESGPLAIGWGSDFNGGVNHFRPRFGKRGCSPGWAAPFERLDVDFMGLGHPGMLPQVWRRLEDSGMGTELLNRSAERFLRIWERVRAARINRES